MPDTDPLAIAAAWFRHVADRDIDAVMTLAADEVEVGGARGAGTGRDLLHEWVDRTRAEITPTQWFAKDDVAVVEYEAVWRNRAGLDMGRRVMVLTFRVEDGRIAGIYRHDDLAASLTLNGLDATDEAEAPGNAAQDAVSRR
jgi:hypothetical protein